MMDVKSNCLLPQESYHTMILHLRDMPISQFDTEALALEDDKQLLHAPPNLRCLEGT